ncbi:nucleotide sugar dehydrogenase [Marinovum sp. 2_MG-2023]|uniref:nucleotide sugar dehydrogenase n=1 Tax=Roseobacteraceae TaxID=2854170 RepID=UPI001FD1ED33|nr:MULTISPECIES: nucleotide sugar dehydrogenase [Roseobacteraceae]MCJ7872824.1 nucleotide sugar dehydrogenase [Phaeobacter sp. J2-8]MDO6730064.1 nucleotide sugar dehydrogenase [Marinovum sp. 2_MG-2023]MDO6779878.1 nucleotide sugar dehydrogenase [Marinovum sp. 1_MG-2023]
MARISVFGIGYVGVVSAACLARDGHQVIAVDVDPGKIDAINAGLSPIVENGLDELIADVVKAGKLTATDDVQHAIDNTDASFIAVGTPSAPDGSVGLKYVEIVCRNIGNALKNKDAYHAVVIRSTIVPGSTEGTCIPTLEEASGKKSGKDFGVGYYPEFLRESTAIEDYYDPGLIVFGAQDKGTADILTEINQDLPCDIKVVDVRTAEMVKYTSNTWRAVKVTFANEIGNIAKSSGLDGQTVMEILCSDTKVNISSYFMRPGFAFGGSCLPKDVRALRHLAATQGTPAHLLNAVLEANEAQIRRAEEMVERTGAKKVGFVGISFKPGTDDLRESPLAELAARLIKNGVQVDIYDPYVHEAYANENSTAGRGNDVIPDLKDRMNPDLDAMINDAGAILVGNFYRETVETLEAASKSRPVLDLTRMNRDKVSDGTYEGICW